jgi:hypothetical protein
MPMYVEGGGIRKNQGSSGVRRTNIGFPGPFVSYQLEQYVFVFWEKVNIQMGFHYTPNTRQSNEIFQL